MFLNLAGVSEVEYAAQFLPYEWWYIAISHERAHRSIHHHVLGVYQCRLESVDNISRYLTVSSQRFAWWIGRFSNEMQKRGPCRLTTRHVFAK